MESGELFPELEGLDDVDMQDLPLELFPEVELIDDTPVKDLPQEMWNKIFFYVPPAERLRYAPVCKTWNEAINRIDTFESVQLVIDDFEPQTTMEVMKDTERNFKSLRMYKVDLGDMNEFNDEFWTNVCPELRELRMQKCTMPPPVLFNILSRCEKLELLEFHDCRTLFRKNIQLVDYLEEAPQEQLKKAFAGVRHLSFKESSPPGITLRFFLDMMPKLTSLDLTACSIDYDEPFQDPEVENEYLELHFSTLLRYLQERRLPITSLNLSNSPISSMNIEELSAVFKDTLLELRLSQCNVLTWQNLEPLHQFKNLRVLVFAHMRLLSDSRLVPVLTNLPELEHLDLKNCDKLTGETCQAISSLLRLQYLDVDSCPFEQEDLIKLAANSELRHLDLTYVTSVGIEAIKAFSTMEHLRVLDLTSWFPSHIDDECLQLICTQFKLLEKLSLSGCFHLSDDGCAHLSKLTRLVDLNLRGVHELTGYCLANGLGSREMKSLCLDEMKHLRDFGLENLCQKHPFLRRISLTNCREITDYGMKIFLKRGGSNLRNITLGKSLSLTDETLENINVHCKWLTYVYFDSCGMTKEALEKFKREHPHTDVRFWEYIPPPPPPPPRPPPPARSSSWCGVL